MRRFSSLQEDLRKWFSKTDPAGGWKRINSKGEAIGPCAREPGEPKPKCMSNEKRASLTKKERASAVRAKRKNDPNPERKGKPINVSNFGKGKISESMKNLNEKNVPTSPEKWAQAKSQARAKFDVYPSAYANGWAAKKYKAMGGGWKSVSEAKDEREYGYEGDMALNQLATLIRCGEMIKELLKPDTDLPEWVQSKITLATDYIQTAADYLYSEMNESSSARLRLANAMKKAQEQREREERAGAALLKPKPVKEDVIQEREDDEYHTPTRHHVQVQVSKDNGPKTHRKATVRAKEPQHAVSAAIAHYKQQGYTVHDHKYLGEEVEQIDEISKELTHSYLKKRYAQTGATRQDKPKGMSRATHDKQLMGLHRATGRLTTTLQLPKGTDPSQGGKYTADSVEINGKPIQEGRASQRHPLEGHEYHKKSDEALVHIAKDAHAAAEAMKSHNTTAENKYRDQANDSATVRHYRKTHGMADWYKKKYGHMNEDTKQDDPPFDKPYTKKPAVVTDKSGAKHSPMSRARDIARDAVKKQSEFLKARNAGSNTKNAKARAAGTVNSHMFESRKADIVREAMKVAKDKKKNNSEDKFIADPELNSRVIKTAAQM